MPMRLVLNPPTLLDAYKLGHPKQYPKGTEIIFSNMTPRTSRVEGVDQVVWVGLQGYVKHYLIDLWDTYFFDLPEDEVVEKFTLAVKAFLGPDNNVDSDNIRELHRLGFLPIEIYSLPEGSLVPLKVAPMVIYNTDNRFGWITNSFETIMSVSLWGPTTSATTAHQYRKLFDDYITKTNPEMAWFADWQGHDFSMRGMFGLEGAMQSGFGHLSSFMGTDTVPAVTDYVTALYGGDLQSPKPIGGSVPATEHSVMCAGGMDNEEETFRRLIEDIYPKGIVSIVSDSFDFWKVLTEFLPRLKSKILAREGKVVIRPDSGDPVRIVAGYKGYIVDTTQAHGPSLETLVNEGYEMVKAADGLWYEITAPTRIGGNHTLTKTKLTDAEVGGAVEALWSVFGGTTTSTGYRQLDPHIGLIYGDSITYERATRILKALEARGLASTNVVFGIGSFTYQHVTRDTYGFAVKATWAQINGKAHEIFKDPKTDNGMKKSARGLIAVNLGDDGRYVQTDRTTWEHVKNCSYQLVFSNGDLVTETTLSEIRDRLKWHHNLQVTSGKVAQ